MINLASELDILLKKKKKKSTHSFQHRSEGNTSILSLKARGAQGVERVLGNLFTFSNAHLIRQDSSKISPYPPPGSRRGRNVLNPLQYEEETGESAVRGPPSRLGPMNLSPCVRTPKAKVAPSAPY